MRNAEFYHVAFLILATLLEIGANVLLKYSDGFRRKTLGILSLLAVLAAFGSLAQAVKGIDLSVAYALWGGFGVVSTFAAGAILFGQRINWRGWVGLVSLIAGMVLIKMA